MGAVIGGAGALFYSGCVNAVFGESGSGKTWLALKLIADVIRDGDHALVLDFESNAEILCGRLLAMGVSGAAVARQVVYIEPDCPWGAFAGMAIDEVLLRHPSLRVVIVDSTGESMAVDGVNPNADDEVARWFRGAPKVLANAGLAVVLLDHTPKARSGAGGYEHAAGSFRKRASVSGAAYSLDVIVPASKDCAGRMRLVVRKDRNGFRAVGDVACEMTLTPATGDSLLKVECRAATTSSESAEWRPTVLMERLCEHLETSGPLGARELRDAPIGRGGARAKAEHVDKAVRLLVAEGYVERPPRGKARLLRRYRAADDQIAK
ncbi:MAG: AAA family ATPase [Actinobacteria bacterium]|nr:AAA family ATPase [Actinomycetota bacterium]